MQKAYRREWREKAHDAPEDLPVMSEAFRAYLEEKGVEYSLIGYSANVKIQFTDVSDRMFNEILLPGMQALAKRYNRQLRTYYNKSEPRCPRAFTTRKGNVRTETSRVLRDGNPVGSGRLAGLQGRRSSEDPETPPVRKRRSDSHPRR
jgi:hypothetical protein